LLVLPLNFGSRGVAIFFVVSGFCIHLSFQQQGRKYSHFFIRRFFRIYPAYLAAVLLFVFLFPKTSLNFSGASAHESWKQLIYHLLLIHNFSGGTFMGINASFWSLAIEVQLYLLYPILLFLVARLGWKQTLLLLGITESIIDIVKPVVVFNAISKPHFLDQYFPGVSNVLMCIYDLGRSPLAYWFSWSLGAVIADYYLQNKPQPLANVPPMTWIGCIVICFLFRPLSEFMFMMGCLLTATILSRLLRDGIKITPHRRGWKFLGKIGIWSYSLYLLHQPILFAMPTAWLNPYGNLAKLVFLGFVGLAVLPLCFLAYASIEAPSLKLGKILVKRLKS
jgi:peptidoglycan/LPS O-acetylase OafA/YrhL